MSDYFYVPGMMYPFWVTYRAENYPKEGESVLVAHNLDADTDMGDLYGPEFAEMFPTAMPITAEQANNRSVTYADWVEWKKKEN